MRHLLRFVLLIAVAAGLAYVVSAARAQRSDAGEAAAMPPAPRAAKRLQASIDKYKTQLVREGKYACCVSPSCDHCATHMGMCPCGKNAAADKPVCRQCKGGWAAGEGVISGKSADQIKVMPGKKGG